MDVIEVVAKIRYEVFQELDLWVARAAQLRLSANGHSPPEAVQNLQEVVSEFFLSCIERGNLIDVLREYHLDHDAPAHPSERNGIMDVPLPLLATQHARRPVG
jgi:hypothetical protein